MENKQKTYKKKQQKETQRPQKTRREQNETKIIQNTHTHKAKSK